VTNVSAIDFLAGLARGQVQCPRCGGVMLVRVDARVCSFDSRGAIKRNLDQLAKRPGIDTAAPVAAELGRLLGRRLAGEAPKKRPHLGPFDECPRCGIRLCAACARR
jgi:hypothetical protein